MEQVRNFEIRQSSSLLSRPIQVPVAEMNGVCTVVWDLETDKVDHYTCLRLRFQTAILKTRETLINYTGRQSALEGISFSTFSPRLEFKEC